ncbi:unnamed protein product [Effrenium voratum]|uniref:Uncharacterized protein n=1 Tax=Effrenium voratum TaxID=2562239 RepID=A0AA36HQ09_9DINO|nr:unnamed protein product [Effrenium voratum]
MTGSNFQDALIVFDPALGPHVSQQAQVAFAQYYSRHINLRSGFQHDQWEPMMIPGIDWCRRREGAAHPVLLSDRQVVQLRAASSLQAGEEIFVHAVQDSTDLLLQGDSKGPSISAGQFLAVPIEGENRESKRLLFKQLGWPAEVRLRDDVQDLKVLRLASMPSEEFTAWSVGALIANAPLAVSRGFRTEAQATAFLYRQCCHHGNSVRTNSLSDPQHPRATVATRYRQVLLEVYGKCCSRARQKMDRLLSWASKQHEWMFRYIAEVVQSCDDRDTTTSEESPRGSLTLPVLSDSRQQLSAAMTVAVVNSKVQAFAPYFQQLLQASLDKTGRLKRIRRLALAMARLQDANIDLSDFEWINRLPGEADAVGTLKCAWNSELRGFVPPGGQGLPQVINGNYQSSLLMRFCESKFDANFVLTIGVDFKWKQVERDARKLKIQVWDTAGQERFRTITPAYYRAAMGVVICYDITDKASFEHIDYWLQQLDQHGDEGVQRVLVGNKSDLNENRKVTREEGEKLATQYNMKFFETSAKTGQEVDEAFLSIADDVVKQRYSDVQPNAAQVKLKKPGKSKGCQC